MVGFPRFSKENWPPQLLSASTSAAAPDGQPNGFAAASTTTSGNNVTDNHPAPAASVNAFGAALRPIGNVDVGGGEQRTGVGNNGAVSDSALANIQEQDLDFFMDYERPSHAESTAPTPAASLIAAAPANNNPSTQTRTHANVPTTGNNHNDNDGNKTSVANRSRLRNDVTKNTGNATAAGTPNYPTQSEQGAVNDGLDRVVRGGEVPKIILTRRRVDDDLTETEATVNATSTGADGVDGDAAKVAELVSRPVDSQKTGGSTQVSVPTQRGIPDTKMAQPYSSKPSYATNSKAATFLPKGPVTTTALSKNTVICSGTKPSAGGGARTTLSPRQVSTQRVSLSPVPGDGKAGAKLSPKAGQFANLINDQAIASSGVARPVANKNPAAVSTMSNVGSKQAGRVLPTRDNPVGNGGANQFAKPGQEYAGNLKMNAITRKKPPTLSFKSIRVTRPTDTAPVETRKPAPNSTSISPAQAKTAGTTPANKNAVVTPYYPQKGSNGMDRDDSSDDTTIVVPGMPTVNTGPKAMEVQPQAEEPALRRPRSNSMYSPPPMKSPASTVTPKASNVAHNANVNTAPATSFNTSHQTDETFGDLLQQFVSDIQAGNDIYERGVNDLLELDVDCTHAFNACLHYKEQYLNLLGEIENIQATADEILADVEDY